MISCLSCIVLSTAWAAKPLSWKLGRTFLPPTFHARRVVLMLETLLTFLSASPLNGNGCLRAVLAGGGSEAAARSPWRHTVVAQTGDQRTRRRAGRTDIASSGTWMR